MKLVLSICFVLAATGAALAQAPPNTTDAARSAVADFGADEERVGSIQTGALRTGYKARVEFAADADQDYRFYVGCPSGCDVLKLALIDEYDNLIDEGGSPDEPPIFILDSLGDGTSHKLIVTVGMAKCSAEPCAYAVGMYKWR
jgi:hypothetical protein